MYVFNKIYRISKKRISIICKFFIGVNAVNGLTLCFGKLFTTSEIVYMYKM